jgi:SAM-dependent methyltransferase
VTDDEGYLLANRQRGAATRLEALGELLDPTTFGHLTRLGVGSGWRCWDVGAGGRSVPEWLVDRVGPEGLVVASDLDTTWLGEGGPTLRVLRHDVGLEGAPATGLDLVHARLVLTHVPRREDALAAMVGALRPGGWLLVEEADPGLQPLLCPDEYGPAQELANRLRRGFRTLMAGREADLAYGRTLPRRLREQGLSDVGADAYFPITAPAATTLEVATVEQIRDRLVAAGIATDDEIGAHLANLAAGLVPDLATSPLVSAWGRRA